MTNSRFNNSKPFAVGNLQFDNIGDAIEAAAAASTLEASAFTAAICQPLQKGANGYQGSSIAIAHFRHGVDLDELAADENGVPDIERRANAFRARLRPSATGIIRKLTNYIEHGQAEKLPIEFQQIGQSHKETQK